MNRIFKTSPYMIVAALLCNTTLAHAEQKVGYVDSVKVFQALPEKEQVTKKLQARFKDRVAEVKALEAKIKTKMEKAQRNAQLMSKDKLGELKIELASLQAQYEVKGKGLEQETQRAEVEERQKLFKVIQKAVQTIAKKEGYDLVIDIQALQYAKPQFDISDKVISAVAK